jgi:hypothetical protein
VLQLWRAVRYWVCLPKFVRDGPAVIGVIPVLLWSLFSLRTVWHGLVLLVLIWSWALVPCAGMLVLLRCLVAAPG